MLYPKGIIDFIKKDDVLRARFQKIIDLNRRINVHTGEKDIDINICFVDFMFEEGFLLSSEIRAFVFYLSSMLEVFNNILRFFDKKNNTSTHKDDIWPAGTNPDELLRHALYIYYLKSHQIPGDTIECGTFKGFSTCCLSWACHFLNTKLVTADSFEGLPENTTDSYYKKGDFKGTLTEVKGNITTLGKIDTVEFLKGYFSTSLKDYDTKINLLWMDVDLYESANDVMEHLLPNLSERGVIISHELFEERDFKNDKLLPTIGPSKALSLFFEKNSIKYKAMPLVNGSGLIIPNTTDDDKILWSEDVFSKIVENTKNQSLKMNEMKIDQLENEKKSLQEKLDRITEGSSFKVGRMMTAPIRWYRKNR